MPSFITDTPLLKAENPPLQGQIEAGDHINLAYAAYTLDKPIGCMIFLHGGGAHSLAGYTFMAEQLCNHHQIATYLFDIRGHGRSEGRRGHTPSAEQVLKDISSAISFVKTIYQVPIYLGGHSSGAGLILNYSSWEKRLPVSGYVMVAPEFGYRVKAKRNLSKQDQFATVNLKAIIANRLSGGYLWNDTLAVTFNYPKEIIEKEGFLSGYTVNMARAVTPDDPIIALKNMEQPTQLLISEKDELIDAQKLENCLTPILKENRKCSLCILPEGGHLLILNTVHYHIGSFIKNLSSI
jgi:acylglycerol lipase